MEGLVFRQGGGCCNTLPPVCTILYASCFIIGDCAENCNSYFCKAAFVRLFSFSAAQGPSAHASFLSFIYKVKGGPPAAQPPGNVTFSRFPVRFLPKVWRKSHLVFFTRLRYNERVFTKTSHFYMLSILRYSAGIIEAGRLYRAPYKARLSGLFPCLFSA